MVKNVHFTLDDETHTELVEAKDKKTWREVVLEWLQAQPHPKTRK